MITGELNRLYETYGYKRFKMSKFEPYELYIDNKDFLNTSQIITFTDLDGELLALKPDVTLSIMKSGLGMGRIYYNENIYRPKDRHYKETAQSGIEYIGKLTTYAEAEVIALAVKSLKLFEDDIRIRISDVSLLVRVFENLNLSESTRILVFKLFESKNSAGLDVLVKKGKIEVRSAEKLKNLMNLYLPFELINSMDYYNGIIFQGAVSGLPFTVLSGGRYDKLARKMGKEAGAIGFALDLSLVENYKEEAPEYDVDYLIIYDVLKDELIKAIKTVEKLTKEGYRVRLVERSEEELIKRIRAGEVLEVRRVL